MIPLHLSLGKRSRRRIEKEHVESFSLCKTDLSLELHCYMPSVPRESQSVYVRPCERERVAIPPIYIICLVGHVRRRRRAQASKLKASAGNNSSSTTRGGGGKGGTKEKVEGTPTRNSFSHTQTSRCLRDFANGPFIAAATPPLLLLPPLLRYLSTSSSSTRAMTQVIKLAMHYGVYTRVDGPETFLSSTCRQPAQAHYLNRYDPIWQPPYIPPVYVRVRHVIPTIVDMRILLLGLLLLYCSFSLTESAITKQRSRKKPSKDQQHRDLNVCDFEQTDSPLFCYCNDNKLDSAEDANCLIFKKLELSDPIWAHFNSQLYIHRLSFIVRSEGEISYIPTAVLRQLKHLNTVSFQHAKLEAIESQSFGTLPSLSTIILNKNNIQLLKWHAFENLRNLTLLNLDENDISELSRDIFYELPKIQKLFLNHNNVSLLHDRAFEHLPTLEELELNNNRISVVTADSFKRLRMLQRLDLRNNLITMLGDRCFAEMPDLKELHLDQNQIKFISSKALDGLRHLKMLRLSENKLVTLEPDFLVGTPALTLLDLRDNQISTMTFDNIKPIITNLYNNSSYFYLDVVLAVPY
ncbi:unnamed protein product [Trichogramma brassicae]|uniref:LRRNT domain-containing protein n=1 Tax=Trichogramma brassicae TaxID=86971 RepID=A0A6H5INS7_9HYME|nr:unnamed protein product [Trichogramma brassicae]